MSSRSKIKGSQAERDLVKYLQETGAVIHKRKGKGNPAEWYATMPVSVWVELLRKAIGEE